MEQRGMRPEVLDRRVELLSEALWLWEGYWEIDREGMSGAITMRGMREVLDEYGVTDRESRKFARAMWRQMFAKELEVAEQKRKAKEEAKQRKEQFRGGGAY